jgi:two-component system sensor histidine kinase HydH
MGVRPMLRMILPMAAMSLALLLLGGLAAWYLHGLQKESSRLLDETVVKLEAAEELEVISHELRYQLRQYLSSRDEGILADVSKLRREAKAWLAKAGEATDNDQQRALVSRIERGYADVFDEVRKTALEGHVGGQDQHLLDLIHDMAASEILEPAREFRGRIRKQMAEATQKNSAVANGMGMGLLLLGTCGAVAGLLAGYGIARGIHRSIAQLTIPVRDAAGRLNDVVGPITVSSGETFEALEASLESMAQRVAAVVQQLQESQLAAARAQQLAAMGQLAAGLAHELRNPLTSMKMLVQSAGGEETVQLDAKDLTVLRQEIDRLERTIQTFLDYARPPKPEKCPVVLREILRQTVDFVVGRARQLGVEIQSELPEPVVEIEADAGQIRQVLLNLLLNALDASSEGKVVSVRMRRESADVPDSQGQRTLPPPLGGSSLAAAGQDAMGTPRADSAGRPEWMTIEVADRGCGLPVEIGERIFQPFVSGKEGGTGLGLPICKRIVEEHGGEIRARNREGGGAVFTIRLPVISEAAPAAGDAV